MTKRTKNYGVIVSGYDYTRSFGSLRAARGFITRQQTPSSPRLVGWRIMWMDIDSSVIIRHKGTGKEYLP